MVITPRVGKDNTQPFPLGRMRRGDKRECRNDNFARKIQSVTDQLHTHGRIADHDAIPHAEKFSQARFELLDQLTIIGEPTPFEDLPDQLIEQFSITDVRPTDEEGFKLFNGRRHGQALRCSLENASLLFQKSRELDRVTFSTAAGRDPAN